MRDNNGTRYMVTPSVLYGVESAVAAINGGEGGFIHIREDGIVFEDGDRACYPWKIYGTDGELIGSGTDDNEVIKSPAYPDVPADGALKAMGALISFLVACAESESEESENYNLFPREVREWAELYSDELTMISVEIEEECNA